MSQYVPLNDMTVEFAQDLAGEIATIAGASGEVSSLVRFGVALAGRLVNLGLADEQSAPGVGELLRQARETDELLALLDDPQQTLEASD